MGPVAENEILYPGDLLEVEFRANSGNQVLIDMAVRNIKDQLYHDGRFDYQGARWETRTDKSGIEGPVVEREYLLVTVLVRKTLREEHPAPQQAALGPILVVTALAVIAGAIIAYAAIMERTNYRIQRTAELQQQTTEAVLADPNLTPAEKTEILTAQAAQPGRGGLLTGLGGAVFAAGVLIGAIYLFTHSGHARFSRYD